MAKEKAIIHIAKEFVSDIRQIIDIGRQQAFTAPSAIFARHILEYRTSYCRGGTKRKHPRRIRFSPYNRIDRVLRYEYGSNVMGAT